MNEKIILMVTIALVLLVLLLYLIHQFLQIGKYEEELKSNLKEIPRTQKELKFLIIFGIEGEQHIHLCVNDREIESQIRYYAKHDELKDYMVFFVPDFIALSSDEYDKYFKKNYEK